MRPGIIDLREFYATPRGRVAARALSRSLTIMRRDTVSPTGPLVAFGYATPVLGAAPADTQHLMPEGQGLATWPEQESNRALLCPEQAWPLPDASAGAVLLMHALEHSPDPAALLAEAWRVLAGQGQLWVVVPNRRGLWALAEGTPFGRGQPYTATQLRRLLHAALFVPEAWRRTLYTPPFKSTLGLATAPLWEVMGAHLTPLHGGVILLRAVKQLYAPVGLVKPDASYRMPLPPAPSLASLRNTANNPCISPS